MLRLRSLWEGVIGGLWFLPTLIVVGFLALAGGVSYLDRTVVTEWGAAALYGGSAIGARAVLATVATSALSLAVLVFTITLIVLQLASTQLSPRVLTLFLQDRWSQTALGVFLGTFGYALLGLWLTVSPTESTAGFVPVLMVTVALLLTALSVVVFINYVHRVSQSIRVESVTESIAQLTMRGVEAGFSRGERNGQTSPEHTDSLTADPDGLDGRAAAGASQRLQQVVLSPRTGTIVDVSVQAMMRWSTQYDASVRLLLPLGAFVAEGTPLLRIDGREVQAQQIVVADWVLIGRERSIVRDPVYGVRQLVDIALRALSPGVNEPGTAVEVLDQLEAILLAVGESSDADSVFSDDGGTVRVVVPQLSWEGWLSLALREIIDYGGESVQVCNRIVRLLSELLSVLPDDRRLALRRYVDEVGALPAAQRPYMTWQPATD